MASSRQRASSRATRWSGTAPDHRRLIAEPVFERLGVGDRRLTIAEQGADLGTMAFGRPARQVSAWSSGAGSCDLPRHLVDRLRIDLRAVRRGTGRGRGRTAARRRSPAGWPGSWPRSVRDRLASASTVRGGSIPQGRSPGEDSVIRTTRGETHFLQKASFVKRRCEDDTEIRGVPMDSTSPPKQAKCQKWLGCRHGRP